MTTKITEQNISNLANIGVQWQSVFTGDGSTGLTAVAGRGYFIDTTSGTVTVTLPASPSTGDVVVLKDYARTWNTNNVTIASTLFDGSTNASTFSTNGQILTIVYMDGTKGWSLINEDTTSSLGATYISATGGTVTESGDFKIHSFTGDGCFVVSSLGNPAGGGEIVDYLIVAGGGGGGRGCDHGSGAGAGGYLSLTCQPICTTTYPITVGAGGTEAGSGQIDGNLGSDSSAFGKTMNGGAGGAGWQNGNGNNGGSGGGSACFSSPTNVGAATQPSSPSGGVGFPGGPAAGSRMGGGGGAGSAGVAGACGGGGGAGLPNSITGSANFYAGGGGGGGNGPPGGCGGSGIGGDGGQQSVPTTGTSGSANTGSGGGGGGGSRPSPAGAAGNGGKGIVIIRYKFQN